MFQYPSRHVSQKRFTPSSMLALHTQEPLTGSQLVNSTTPGVKQLQAKIRVLNNITVQNYIVLIPVQPLVVKLKYKGMHLSHNIPPMPCLQTHVPEDMEQFSVICVPIGLQSQAVQ